MQKIYPHAKISMLTVHVVHLLTMYLSRWRCFELALNKILVTSEQYRKMSFLLMIHCRLIFYSNTILSNKYSACSWCQTCKLLQKNNVISGFSWLYGTLLICNTESMALYPPFLYKVDTYTRSEIQFNKHIPQILTVTSSGLWMHLLLSRPCGLKYHSFWT